MIFFILQVGGDTGIASTSGGFITWFVMAAEDVMIAIGGIVARFFGADDFLRSYPVTAFVALDIRMRDDQLVL
jgi:hypothetical protein